MMRDVQLGQKPTRSRCVLSCQALLPPSRCPLAGQPKPSSALQHRLDRGLAGVPILSNLGLCHAGAAALSGPPWPVLLAWGPGPDHPGQKLPVHRRQFARLFSKLACFKHTVAGTPGERHIQQLRWSLPSRRSSRFLESAGFCDHASKGKVRFYYYCSRNGTQRCPKWKIEGRLVDRIQKESARD